MICGKISYKFGLSETIKPGRILQALAAGTDPITGKVFSADSPYNQPEIIRALFFAIDQLEALAKKGNQGLAWSVEEDALLAQRFNDGIKITQLAKLH
ncbi:hypothetical protein SRABI27_03930 [Pedobacter sp. Bi27]|nr:hypothetical protein SRABI27_03930 [Pedobacter sp. Bi27]